MQFKRLRVEMIQLYSVCALTSQLAKQTRRELNVQIKRERSEISHSESFACVRAVTECLTDLQFRETASREELQNGVSSAANMIRANSLPLLHHLTGPGALPFRSSGTTVVATFASRARIAWQAWCLSLSGYRFRGHRRRFVGADFTSIGAILNLRAALPNNLWKFETINFTDNEIINSNWKEFD